MSDFYIDPVERKKIITRWIVVTLVSLHIWASLIVMAAIFGARPNAVLLGGMFSTVTTGIGMTIFILLVDKGADFIITRFGAGTQPTPASVKETVVRTVETKPGVEAETEKT